MELNVAYVIDNNKEQLKFLRMSIDTLLKYNKVDNIYIMYYSVSKSTLLELLKYVPVRIEYFKFDNTLIDLTFPKLPNACNLRLYYPSLSRWWITRVIKHSRFWYIDTDVLFKENIRKKFLDILKLGYLMYAFNRKLYDKNYKNTLIGSFESTGYLNAGIMYMDAKLFNSLGLFNYIINYYKRNSNKIKYVNLTGYLHLFDKYPNLCKVEISDSYNLKIPDYSNFKYWYDKIKIFHFNGEDKKPLYVVYKKIMEGEFIP